MIQALYTAASGMVGQQKNIDVIANNVSNINTDGFKMSRLDFQDCLYRRMLSPVDNSPQKNLQHGTGAIEYQVAKLFLQGPIRDTDRPLDFSLEGNGFFMVENPNPLEENEGLDEILYTRSGNFYISPETEGAEGGYLVDSSGRFVLSSDGERIFISDPSTLAVDTQGYLSQTDYHGTVTEIAWLGLADFTNRSGLASVGDNLYMATLNSGDETEAMATVRSNSLESSNVDYGEEVTRLIRAQRAYQIASRCITTADQMMQQVNNIRQ